MRRRTFVSVGCCSICGISSGCLGDNNSEFVPEISSIEVRNDQREDGHEFKVQIRDGEDVVFERAFHLPPTTPDESGIVIDQPVPPGAYSVRVETDEHSATVDTQDLISNDQTCIRLQFYLESETLHSEHQLYNQCE